MSKLHEAYSLEVSNYFNKLSSNSFEKTQCIFCGDKGRRYKIFTKETLHVFRCDCGHVYSGYQPTQEALDVFYEKSNAMSDWANIKKTDIEELKQRQKYQKVVDFIKENEVNSVLDIGCGNGFFLSMLPKEIEKVGVDQNEAALKVATSKGLNCMNFSVEEILNIMDENNHTYDAITLFGVLEHLKDPLWLMDKLKKYINKYLIVIVPNVDSAVVRQTWRECFTFCPQHLNYFSADSLWLAYRESGYKEVAYWTIEPELKPTIRASHGFPPYGEIPEWAMDSIYSTEIHKTQEEAILKMNQGYKIVFIGEKCDT